MAMTDTPPFATPKIASVFEGYAPSIQQHAMHLRSLIFATAGTLNVGPICESLKWGQPSYVPTAPKTGTAVRLGLPKSGGIGMFVHCQTDILSAFTGTLPPSVTVDGNRGVLFVGDVDDVVAAAVVRAAFTYYL